MTIRLRYWLFIGFLHLAIGGLTIYLLWEQKVWIFVVEIAVLFSLFIAFRIYRNFIQPVEFIGRGADAILDQDFNVKLRPTGSKDMDKLVTVYNAMIDNIREERTQVQQQHYFLQKLINASPAGILILNYDGQLTEYNPQAEAMLRLKPSDLGTTLQQHSHPLLRSIAEVPVGESKIISGKSIERFKCQVSHFVHRGFNRKFVLFQELSKEIISAEKRAYGKIIRMMAHEVNNSIGAINSILQSMLDFYDPNSPDWETDFRTTLQIAVQRNDRLNRFMKNFAEVVRLPAPHFESLDLHEMLQNIARLMTQQAKDRVIEFEWDLASKPFQLQADPRQLEQVFVNIFKNALESIGQSGTIRIHTTTEPLRLQIMDNGAGIAPEVADKLFSPFFSTKPEGQGVGLTLIREILVQHEADFSLRTHPSGWTVFEIIFKKN